LDVSASIELMNDEKWVAAVAAVVGVETVLDRLSRCSHEASAFVLDWTTATFSLRSCDLVEVAL
jgi:hypothetical protein